MFTDNPNISISDAELALPFDVLEAQLKAKAKTDAEYTPIQDLPRHATREAYLSAFVDIFRPRLVALNFPLPASVRVSIGFPSKGGLSTSRRTLGQCWPWDDSKDGTHEIFISPLVSDPLEVLAVLVHELGHAAVGCDKKHGPEFKAYCKAVGLEGKATSTNAGEELRHFLNHKLTDLGEYPGAPLVPKDKEEGEKKPGSRMLKVVCQAPECGYTLRTTKQWVLKGLPTCCCGAAMTGPDFDANGDVIEGEKP